MMTVSRTQRITFAPRLPMVSGPRSFDENSRKAVKEEKIKSAALSALGVLIQFGDIWTEDKCRLSPKTATGEEQLRRRLGAEDPDISYVIAEIYVRTLFPTLITRELLNDNVNIDHSSAKHWRTVWLVGQAGEDMQ
ncbi:hypothetical protein GBF38_021656 [Nibea albiflora]|uniref:Uncharacterized protein n=1 Tax=Nibea albiflora TaxID=240163 RepID=A0ACB7FJS2_NIBAL|nr:hypothetical protein GBF38_021656 [Nibea albiflora]